MKRCAGLMPDFGLVEFLLFLSLGNYGTTGIMQFKKIISVLILSCISFILNGQPQYTLTNDPVLRIENYSLLPDPDHPRQILKSSKNEFEQANSLIPGKADFCWIKVSVYNPYPGNENYFVSFSIPLNYTLYFANRVTNKTVNHSAGPALNNRNLNVGAIPIVIPKQGETVLYFKINMHDINRYGYTVKPQIILEKKISFDSRNQLIWFSWLVCCVAIISFSFFNLYIYYSLKDKIYLYYIAIQVGSIIYLTGLRKIANVLLPFRLYNIRLLPNGSANIFDINMLFEYIGLVILVYGSIQLTRAYLQTKTRLTAYDKILKYMLYGYALTQLIPELITITGLWYINILVFDNLYLLLILLFCIVVSAVAYKHHIWGAKEFMLANTLPIIFTTIAVLFNVTGWYPISFLPEIAAISQILTFGIALVARIRVVYDQLKLKELEAVQLTANITIDEYKRLLIEQENKHILETIEKEKDKNIVLQQKLEANQRELVGNSVYIHQKNKLLTDLKSQIQDIDIQHPYINNPAFKNIRSSLTEGQYLDDEWSKFKLHFEQVHPSFFADLQKAYPALTKYEQRLYAYFHINLSTKEIATLLNIVPTSVRQAKARLNKKMKG